MDRLLKDANGLQNELAEIRRWLHAHAETGFNVAETRAYIKEKLQEWGYAPEDCGKAGVIATVGKQTGTCLVLRADMDALPIHEETGLAFAAKNGNMHACGHDMHATMLLGAAKLLKTREKELKREVRLLFQPAEELLEGAKDVIKAGALPKKGIAVMLHVMTGMPMKTGTVVVSSAGVSAPAADYFTVTVEGKACHGSAPQNGVDAIAAAARILLALEEISARELPPSETAVLTVGTFQGGSAGNAIADRVEMKGTLRAFSEETRAFLKKRLKEISDGVASTFRARAKVNFQGGCPTLVNDEKVSKLAYETLKETLKGDVFYSAELSGGVSKKSGGSEDFAYISHELPSVMIALAAGDEREGCAFPLHHPKVTFDERALSLGSYVYAKLGMLSISKNS